MVLACPATINPNPPYGAYVIQFDSYTVSAGGQFMASQDALLCGQLPGATCSVAPVTATWTTSNCPAGTGNAAFTPTNAKGTLGQYTVTMFSSDVSCNVATTNPQNAATLSGGFTTYTGTLGTGTNMVSNNVLADPANDVYVFSCVGGTVTVTTSIPPSVTTHTLAASDWYVSLGHGASNASHQATISEVDGLGTVPGIYDLGGDNGNNC
jgi:hypothetical protein